MNVLLNTDAFLPHAGGSRVYYYTLYSELVRQYPDQVTVLTKKVPGWEDFDRDHATPALRIRRRFHPLPDWRYTQLPKFLPDLVRTAWSAGGGRTDIMHCGDLFPQGLVAVVLKRLLGIPFIAYCHGEEVTQIDHRRFQPRMRDLVYHSADAVIAANEFARSMLLRIGVPAERIFKILPGVDLETFSPRPPDADLQDSLGLHGKVVLLSVGRLVERKGHSQILRALAALPDSLPAWHYLIVGEGPERERIEALVGELGLSDRVTLAGKVPASRLAAYFNLGDLFVLANRDIAGDLEGFGMVFLEANACGKAVLGGRTGGTSEAVIENVTGRLVDPENIFEITAALSDLIDKPELRRSLGERGLQRARAEFAWSTRAPQLRAVSDRVLQARCG